jgi:hypothetical protein
VSASFVLFKLLNRTTLPSSEHASLFGHKKILGAKISLWQQNLSSTSVGIVTKIALAFNVRNFFFDICLPSEGNGQEKQHSANY